MRGWKVCEQEKAMYSQSRDEQMLSWWKLCCKAVIRARKNKHLPISWLQSGALRQRLTEEEQDDIVLVYEKLIRFSSRDTIVGTGSALIERIATQQVIDRIRKFHRAGADYCTMSDTAWA